MMNREQDLSGWPNSLQPLIEVNVNCTFTPALTQMPTNYQATTQKQQGSDTMPIKLFNSTPQVSLDK